MGLTKTYNLFHDPDLSPEAVEKASKQSAEVAAEAYQDILKLRDLHRQMDEAVLAAYGWHEDSEKWGPAIDLRHDFYEVDYLPENDRIRYTIHPDRPPGSPEAPAAPQPRTLCRRGQAGAARQEKQEEKGRKKEGGNVRGPAVVVMKGS